MKAGELTADYLGSTITADNVGVIPRTVVIVLASVQHDHHGQAGAYRTLLTGTDGRTVILAAGHDIELTHT